MWGRPRPPSTLSTHETHRLRPEARAVRQIRMSAEQCDTPAGHRECAPRRVEGAVCGSYDGLQECWIQDFREEPAVTRDRDPAGRPRQARPRDALGRPLPYGAVGVEPVPEEPLPPMKSLQIARELVKAGRPFAAHEVLEARWKTGPAEERDLWQGLAQLCVGLTHASRGNSVGALRLVERGAGRLGSYGTGGGPTYGLDLTAVVACARGQAAKVDDG